jgi:hypothetical protein
VVHTSFCKRLRTEEEEEDGVGCGLWSIGREAGGCWAVRMEGLGSWVGS